MSVDFNPVQSTYVQIVFKPYDRWNVIYTEQLFRQALDTVGLEHIEVPEIWRTLMDWGIEFKMSDIGEHLDDIIKYLVNSGEMRYVEEPHLFTEDKRETSKWLDVIVPTEST